MSADEGDPPQYRKSCKRENIPGHAHALTFSCFQRRPFLNRDRSRSWMLDAMERARERHNFHVWAFVIMPEHCHLLVFPVPAEYSVSDFLTTIKQSVSRRAITYAQRYLPTFLPAMTDVQPNGATHLRFWQRGGGYDGNLWTLRRIWDMIDYIHANPVRRRLCDLPAQ